MVQRWSKVVITVNDYKQIRQRYLAGESQRHIAKELGISRNTVAKYCEGGSVPWERKTPERESTVITDEVTNFILACLEEDNNTAIKKQKHTAKRIYDRLVEEKGFTGGESTIRRKVREIKGKLPQAFVPLQFDPGDAIQIDWGEADIYENGVRIHINLFCARLCYSCKPIVLAYHRQNEESFLDAIVRTFSILGGVTKRVIFDNGKVAVKEGFGAYAKMQSGYAALCAHYGYEAVFCNPAEGHEKGLVEGLVGWARRNICVPVPRVSSIGELNQILLDRCRQYEETMIKSRHAYVKDLLTIELQELRPLPKYRFETAKCMDTRVSMFSTVRFRSNSYSVPVKYVGSRVSIKGYPESVEIYHKGTLISVHDRLMSRNQYSYHLEDYLPLLERRPRAVFDAAPVKQNIPPEILEQFKAQRPSRDNVIEFLNYYADKQTSDRAPLIKDIVTVRPVDLHQYDLLSIGKEEAVYE